MCYRTRTRRHCTPTLPQSFASLVGMVDTAGLNPADLRIVRVRLSGEASRRKLKCERRPFGGGGRGRLAPLSAQHGGRHLMD